MDANTLTLKMVEYLNTNFGTSDEPNFPTFKMLQQLCYDAMTINEMELSQNEANSHD